MIKSDCQYSKVIIKLKMTEEHTEDTGTKEREGWAESLRPRSKPSPDPRCHVEVFPCVQNNVLAMLSGEREDEGTQGSKSYEPIVLTLTCAWPYVNCSL